MEVAYTEEQNIRTDVWHLGEVLNILLQILL